MQVSLAGPTKPIQPLEDFLDCRPVTLQPTCGLWISIAEKETNWQKIGFLSISPGGYSNKESIFLNVRGNSPNHKSF